MASTTSTKVCSHIHFTDFVVTNFTLPLTGDLKFSNLNHDNTCAYLDNKMLKTQKKTRKYMIRFEDLL